MILGLIAESVLETDWYRTVQELVLDPPGMDESGLLPIGNPAAQTVQSDMRN